MNDKLPTRSINSVKWTSLSNILSIIIGLIQSIILARLLPVKTFGITAGAFSIVLITSSLPSFGMWGAFVHRADETKDLNRAANVQFTLQLLLNLIWTSLMLVYGFIFIGQSDGDFFLAFLVILLSKSGQNLMVAPSAILSRKLLFKRIALIRIVDSALSFIVAIFFALLRQPLWALLSGYIITFIVNLFFLYLWRPFWKPKFSLSPSIVKYYINFGSKNLLGQLLHDVLDRLDEVWINQSLGSFSLGIYSKSYSLAGYPASIIANSISAVAVGTFAELKTKRKRLSDAFYKTNSFLIISGFFIGGLLLLVIPEAVNIFLGEKWLPMVTPFRLMLPFTLFNPMQKTLFHLFVAVGKPEVIIRVRIIQVVLLILGLFLFGTFLGLEGVAIAVDIMLISGIIIVLFIAKQFVDFKIMKLINSPIYAFIVSIILGFVIDHTFFQTTSDIVSGLVKTFLFSTTYIIMFLVIDRDRLLMFYNMTRKYIFKSQNS